MPAPGSRGRIVSQRRSGRSHAGLARHKARATPRAKSCVGGMCSDCLGRLRKRLQAFALPKQQLLRAKPRCRPRQARSSSTGNAPGCSSSSLGFCQQGQIGAVAGSQSAASRLWRSGAARAARRDPRAAGPARIPSAFFLRDSAARESFLRPRAPRPADRRPPAHGAPLPRSALCPRTNCSPRGAVRRFPALHRREASRWRKRSRKSS